MSKRTDSNSYTMIFAVIMVLVVGSILAFLASSLKPNSTENKRIEKQQNILYAMGVNENESPVQILFLPQLLETNFRSTLKNNWSSKETIFLKVKMRI